MASNAENNRQLIIEAATKIFKRHGFEKTTLNDVAKALGKSRTSVYTYFKNKDDLFLAQAENEMAPMFQQLKSILPTRGSAIEKIKLFNAIKFSFINTKQKNYLLLNKELIRNPKLRETLVKLTAENEIKIMQDIIISGSKSGEFNMMKPKAAKLISSVFYIAMNAIVYDLFEKDDWKSFIPSSKIIETMLIEMLKKKPH